MKIGKRRFDVNMFVLFTALMIVAVVMTYIVADYTNRTKIENIRVEYEYRILTITTKTGKFFDNYSKALTYLDVARSDLKNALYYIDTANYSIQRADYGNANYRSKAALHYFNLSNREFKISFTYLNSSIKHTNETKLLHFYINYTIISINMTETGKNMSTVLSLAAQYYSQGSASKGNNMIATFNSLEEKYQQQSLLLDYYLTEIKNYYGIRE